jgi:hypothetical protein
MDRHEVALLPLVVGSNILHRNKTLLSTPFSRPLLGVMRCASEFKKRFNEDRSAEFTQSF